LASEPIAPLHGGLKLITMGRLTPQKGYDLLVATAKLLQDSSLDFKWYVLGVGPLQEDLNRSIAANQLENSIVFLGLKENPYPYILQSDIYVQPSRFEGKSVALDEAKLLQKPIVVTNFSTAADQIQHEKNGLVVAMDAQAIAAGILRLANDLDLQKSFASHLRTEMVGNEREVEKLYAVFGA
jgi:glycosyltransferase involved in cell wall biosynthesis